MSLMERVRAVADVNGITEGALPRRLTVEELREDVREWVSFETIAAILVDNPQRARNELRTACRRALSEQKWDALSGAEKRQITEEMIDVVFGMGPVEGLIADESVTEIMVNGANSIYFERDGKLESCDLTFDSDEQVRVLIDRIIGPLGRRIDESSPMVNARLPQGHRVHAVIPPITPDGPHLTIRAFTRKVFTLEEMESRGSFGSDVRLFLKWLVQTRKNVVVSGGTGSGKTSFQHEKKSALYDRETLVADYVLLRETELLNLTFQDVFERHAKPRDFVYVDPPYLKTSGSYTKYDFGIDEHEELASMRIELVESGVHVLARNSIAQEVFDLYSHDAFRVMTLNVRSGHGKKGGRVRHESLSHGV